MSNRELTEAVRISSFLQEVSKPNLENLAYALRHPKTWPKRFVWDYNDCGQCAMGLAMKLWHMDLSFCISDDDPWVSWAARNFAMPYTEAAKIFIFAGLETLALDRATITPEMIAELIEEYVAKNP